MNDPRESEQAPSAAAGAAAPPPGDNGREGEEVDALPVLAQETPVARAYPLGAALGRGGSLGEAVLPAVQAAAVAAGSFVAGAAVVGLVHRRQRRAAGLAAKGRRAGRGPRRRARGKGLAGRSGELVQIVGSRSLLVDVHLLGDR